MKYFWTITLTFIFVAVTFLITIPLGLPFLFVFQKKFKNLQPDHKPLFMLSLTINLLVLLSLMVFLYVLVLLGQYLSLAFWPAVYMLSSWFLLIHYLVAFKWVYADELKNDAPSPRKFTMIAWTPLYVYAVQFFGLLFTSEAVSDVGMAIHDQLLKLSPILLLSFVVPIIIFLSHNDLVVKLKALKALLAVFILLLFVNYIGKVINGFVGGFWWNL